MSGGASLNSYTSSRAIVSIEAKDSAWISLVGILARTFR